MISAKVITPHIKFNPNTFRDEILREANQTASDVRVDFGKTTRTWKHKPEFKTKVVERMGQTSIDITTNDKIYGYVDQGTRPHIIKPKRRGYPLKFNSRHRAKTRPYVIGSTGGMSAPPVARAMEVKHPGNKPREFAREIQAKWQPKLKTRIESAIAKAAKKSGHGV